MNFDFFTPSRLFFGPGKIDLLPEIIQTFGKTILLITGGKSFRNSIQYKNLTDALGKNNISLFSEAIKKEPSPEDIDTIVASQHHQKINVVVAIGGGSVLDAGKAISAMLTKKQPVIKYLEGVGDTVHDGNKIPFIAVPTTAGTGSEATKNAVISQVGPQGFKKSLRHDNFVPDMAIIDPELMVNCPPDITSACGMDALTQLLESLVSTKATPLTDALAFSALNVLKDSLIRVNTNPQNIQLRSNISYAAYISGLTLANAGLGAVHGFASVIGGGFDIPHGVVCGILTGPVTRINIERLIETDAEHHALKKYGKAAALLDPEYQFKNPVESAMHLADLLEKWAERINMPSLKTYGIQKKDIKHICEKTGIKNNPCRLSSTILEKILSISL